MTCAYFSALMGHNVTVFEGRNKLGGMMRYGIPAYRFPRERLDEDIRAILSVGNIDVEYNHRIDEAEMARIASLGVGACECLCVCLCACLWLVCSLRKVEGLAWGQRGGPR